MDGENEMVNAIEQLSPDDGNERITEETPPLSQKSIASPAREPSSIKETAKAQDASRLASRWWASLPLLTLLAIIFYAQGRAFTEAYLDYFGLNSSQFPVSPDDAYWYAFMAWGVVASKAPGAIWHAYPKFLLAEWVPLVVTVAIPFIALIGDKYSWPLHLRRWFEQALGRFGKKNISITPSRNVVKQVALGGLPSLLMASIPLMLLAITFILALMIVVFVLPFWGLGQRQARADCATEASSHQIVHYEGEQPIIDKDGKPLSPARLLQCSQDFCAAIRNGQSYVIPKAAIRSVDGLSIGRKAPSSPVPKEQQFCTKIDKVPSSIQANKK